VAAGRNPRLRAFYQYQISRFRPEQLVFVDESGTDRRIGFRKTGWSPLGIAPVQRQALARGDRYQILPAYTSESILAASIYKGVTDTAIFEEFLENVLLPKCGKYPAKNSVIVMDNATIHHSERIPQLCADAGVKLVYLPPYSPDYNPIEEFFSELKAFVKKSWRLYLNTADRSHAAFRRFLGFCVLEVGQRKRSAQGHFWNAGLICEGYES
jgi:transposase